MVCRTLKLMNIHHTAGTGFQEPVKPIGQIVYKKITVVIDAYTVPCVIYTRSAGRVTCFVCICNVVFADGIFCQNNSCMSQTVGRRRDRRSAVKCRELLVCYCQLMKVDYVVEKNL